MGFRTLVLLYNDQTGDWSNDPELGKKIMCASTSAMNRRQDPDSRLDYGQVVECCHADTQTLAVVDSYSFTPLGYSNWHHNQQKRDMQVELLKKAADELGYRLVKKANT